MDPYTPTEQDVLEEARGDLPMVRNASYVLWFLGIVYFLIAVGYSLFFGAMPMLDPELGPEALPVFIGIAIGMFLFMMVFTIPMFAAAIGLRRGKMWAWIITVCVGGLFAPSLCLPFGAFLLYAMLNEETRKAFLGN